MDRDGSAEVQNDEMIVDAGKIRFERRYRLQRGVQRVPAAVIA
jgi:hypothetical protein